MTKSKDNSSDSKSKTSQGDEKAIYAAGQWRLAWRKFRRNRMALLGGIVLTLMYLGAILSGFVAPYEPDHRFTTRDYVPPRGIHFFGPDGFHLRPFVYGIAKDVDDVTGRVHYSDDESVMHPVKFFVRGDEHSLGPITSDLHLFGIDAGPDGQNGVFLLGTDAQGRDMFSRLFYGARISLTVGMIGVLLSVILGTVLGVVSGYFGGVVDILIQRTIEILRSFPHIPLWMALSAAIPADMGQVWTYMMITIILSLLGWTGMARNIRGQVLALKEEPYIQATRLLGGSHTRVIFMHLIPGVSGYVIVIATLAIPAMILGESALSFLGLGIRPPMVSWGSLLQIGQNLDTLFYYPWQLAPAGGIILAVLSFNFLGDGLRDALDPHAVGRR